MRFSAGRPRPDPPNCSAGVLFLAEKIFYLMLHIKFLPLCVIYLNETFGFGFLFSL
jgi:hypothetical protein